MYIKVFYSLITDEKIEIRSITRSKYAIVYPIGQWVAPSLPGSLLFVYDNLFNALVYHKRPLDNSLPYMGLTFWEVQVMNPRRIWPVKDPPDWGVELFWKLYHKDRTWKPDKYDTNFSWIYKYQQEPLGIYGCDRVRIDKPVDFETFQRVPQLVLDK